MVKYCCLLVLFAFPVFAQQINSDRKQIEDYNSAFARAFIQKDKLNLIKPYTESSVFMPEHSRQRVGKKSIADFYEQWLRDTKINSYQKTIFELIDLGNFKLEIGTFDENLQLKGEQTFAYSGKYMILWKQSSKKNQPMTIAAEIWGANSYFDDKQIPDINDENNPVTTELNASYPLTAEVKARNNKIQNLVQKRLGAEHAKLFMSDAIYLTYYTPMLIGTTDITNYFIEHEKPGTLKIDSISIKTSGIIDAKNTVVEFGFYSVDWSDGDKKGNVKGKSINVWKKNAAGELMLFRQIVNHD